MAVTQNSYIGNNSTTQYQFTFPYLKTSDIKASLDATVTTAFTLPNATTVQFNTAPATGAKIKIYRETDDSALNATFYAGSAIKSEDLNDNFTQNLYSTQEVTARYLSNLGGTMVGDFHLGEDVVLTFEGGTDDAYETTLTVAEPTADRTITLPNITGTVVTTGDTGTINATMLAANSVDSSELVDGSVDLSHMSANSVDSNQYVDGSVDRVHLAADIIDGTKIADDVINSEHIAAGAVDLEHMSVNSIDSNQYVDGSIDRVHLEADIIDGTKLADNAVDSEHITAGSIDVGHMSVNSIDSDQYVDGSIDGVHIANDQIDSQHYVAGSIDLEHMSANSVDSNQYVDGSIDRVHLSADIIDATKIEDNAVTTDHIADAELTTLAGMQSGTASILASGTALTSTTAELNLLDGKSVVTTVSGSSTDVQLPTAKAVNDQILSITNALGGFVAIADKDNFPTSNPDPSDGAGTVVSISNATGISVNSSGVGSLATRAGGSDAVIINGFPSALRGGATVGSATNANPYVLPSSVGLQVQTTSTAHTYDYHKYLINEEDANKLSGDIQDFQERYRVASSAPSSSKDDGDLWFDTANGKMMVYNASTTAWEEVTSTGNFYINTISSYSGTGGNSATFNGTAYRFVLSNAPTSAQQLLVSINGVVQKPNTGTGQPSEGFAINGTSIVFSAAPASGSDYFIITIGSAVSIGTPSDNTVATAKIQNAAVTTDKIADNSVTGDKVSDNLELTGKLTFAGDGHTKGIELGADADVLLYHDNSNAYFDNNVGDFHIRNDGSSTSEKIKIQAKGGEESIIATADGAVELFHNNSTKFETTSEGTKSYGNLRVSGAEGAGVSVIIQADEGDDMDDFSRLRKDTDGSFGIDNFKNGSSWERNIKCISDLAVELNFNDVKKFETHADGIHVTGDVSITGHYLADDNEKLKMGDAGDLQIYHDSVQSVIKDTSGKLQIFSEDIEIYDADAGYYIDMVADGAVNLYWDNSLKLETKTYGVHISDKLTLPDGASNGIRVGADGDIQIYHDGTNSIIQNDTGAFVIKGDDFRIKSNSTNEDMIRCYVDGTTELYWGGTSNGKKLETTSTGVQVERIQNTTASNDPWLKGTNSSGTETSYIKKDGGAKLDTLILTSRGFQQGTFSDTGGSVGIKHNNWSNNELGIAMSHQVTGGQSVMAFYNPNGNVGYIQTSASATIYATSSDYRLKENEVAISDGITRLKQLKPYRFNFKKDPSTTIDGFFAHEVESVVPQAVSGTKDQVATKDEGTRKIGDPMYQGLDYGKITPLLTAALQEAITKIETLETKVAALEAG